MLYAISEKYYLLLPLLPPSRAGLSFFPPPPLVANFPLPPAGHFYPPPLPSRATCYFGMSLLIDMFHVKIHRPDWIYYEESYLLEQPTRQLWFFLLFNLPDIPWESKLCCLNQDILLHFRESQIRLVSRQIKML